MNPKFATYFYPEVFSTSKPPNEIDFQGKSYHHYNQIRKTLRMNLKSYASLPLRKAKLRDYLTVHTEDYMTHLALKALGKSPEENSQSLRELPLECQGLEYCLPGYLYGLGGLIEALEQMKNGQLDSAYCFSLVGHHAYQDWGHGYCLLNPLAAAVRYAQKIGFERVLIIDWDIHHGDGTQSIFSGDNTVYCLSIHSAVDLYMLKASHLKLGTTTYGEKVGHCNIPIIMEQLSPEVLKEEGLTGKFYRGSESIEIFKQSLNQLPWKPDLITIFSGYDSHKDDCGQYTTAWDNEDFKTLTRIVKETAQEWNCPILSTHGGGYNPEVTVSAALEHIKELSS